MRIFYLYGILINALATISTSAMDCICQALIDIFLHSEKMLPPIRV